MKWSAPVKCRGPRTLIDGRLGLISLLLLALIFAASVLVFHPSPSPDAEGRVATSYSNTVAYSSAT